MPGRLTTTSFALLGLLRLRPFSAYELTKYMQHSALADLWPRTEAAIYREGNRLVDQGLARASVEHNGGRRRTIYEITEEGRRAVEAWLEEPGSSLSFECEAAVKAFFGDAGDVATLRRHLGAVAARRKARAVAMVPVMDRWLEGQLEFPDRVHLTAMAADLIARVTAAADEWAETWLTTTADWDDTELDATKQAQALEVIASLRAAAAARR
jgi:PadR family transcriptional regulator, regulatory protein AphA